MDRVKDILLTLEITHPDGTPDETLSVHSDVYADQDRNHHILLVTQDSDITPAQLECVAFLHNPPDDDLPKEVADAGGTDPQEWYTLFIRDRLTQTPEAALQETLATVANAAQYLDLAQAGVDHPVSASSSSGAVRVTYDPNPGAARRAGLFLGPVGVRLKDLPEDLPQVRAPLAEKPGSIRSGQVLQFTPLGPKLETIQPPSTPWNLRFHPLTVLLAPGPPADELALHPDTLWAVREAHPDHLVLSPLSREQVARFSPTFSADQSGRTPDND